MGYPITPGMDVLGAQLGKAKEAERGEASTKYLLGLGIFHSHAV